MIAIGDTLVSEDVFEKEFVCNLAACKGACCVEGDAGAPLEEGEVSILEAIYNDLLPFLSKAGADAIRDQGVAIMGAEGEWETPLVKGKECAYAIFDENTIASCAIEKAYQAGVINWRKPISCYLYPIRLQNFLSFTAVNYHQWGICHKACALGKTLQVPVYEFVKDALIQKFGVEWYDKLNRVAAEFRGTTNL